MSMTSNLVDELRKYAEEYRTPPWGNYNDGKKEILRKAADTIEELSLKLHNSQMERSSMYYNGGWVSTNDCFPPQPKENKLLNYKPLELYLICLKDCDYPFIAFWNGKYFIDGVSKVQNIEYYMPLPLPPAYEPKED